MTSDRLLDRVRAANPAPMKTTTDDELFARIVAGPRDPRLPRRTRSRRLLRVGARRLALVAAAVVLTAAGGTAGAIQFGVFTHASPKALFKADPAGRWSPDPDVQVIPGTVHRATTFSVPGVGRFEYWIALSRPKGWLCNAIRQPDGSWADLGTPHDKYQMGGPVPGCGTSP
jgi:hypothetical protein